jgi:hypothetical protein
MTTDFHEDDEPTADVQRQFERSEKGATRRPDDDLAEIDLTEAEIDAAFAAGQPVEVVGRDAPPAASAERLTKPTGFTCSHMTITGAGLTNVQGPCGCAMAPMYAAVTA